jgi:hypothetical protein
MLADRSLLAQAAEATQTTLVMVGFEGDGRVRWGKELSLPVPAGDRAQAIPAGDGAVVMVPLGARDAPHPTLFLRVDAHGTVAWATTTTLLDEVSSLVWSEAHGLTITSDSLFPRPRNPVLARLAPTGDAMWARRIDGPEKGWSQPSPKMLPDGGTLVSTVGDYHSERGTSDLSIARFDAQGAVVWRTITWSPARLDVSRLHPEIVEVPLKMRDLGEELARTERRDGPMN